MTLKKIHFFLILILSVLFFAGCKKYTVIETDEYIFELPVSDIEKQQYSNKKTEIILDKKNTDYTVWVIRKNKREYISIDECVSKELSFFLEAKETENLITKNTEINGIKSVVISGVNLNKKQKCYWSFAVVPSGYYYYILRVISFETKFSFNEYYNNKIIRSFKVK